jgi:hypothetical protein
VRFAFLPLELLEFVRVVFVLFDFELERDVEVLVPLDFEEFDFELSERLVRLEVRLLPLLLELLDFSDEVLFTVPSSRFEFPLFTLLELELPGRLTLPFVPLFPFPPLL